MCGWRKLSCIGTKLYSSITHPVRGRAWVPAHCCVAPVPSSCCSAKGKVWLPCAYSTGHSPCLLWENCLLQQGTPAAPRQMPRLAGSLPNSPLQRWAFWDQVPAHTDNCKRYSKVKVVPSGWLHKLDKCLEEEDMLCVNGLNLSFLMLYILKCAHYN